MLKQVLLGIGAVVVIGCAFVFSIQRMIQQNAPRVMPTRAYAVIPFDQCRSAALTDIVIHRADVDTLLQEREKIPPSERHRLLPTGQVFTRSDFNAEFRSFYQQRMVQNYADTTSDRGETKEKCLRFLNSVAEWYVEGTPEVSELKKLALEATDSGSSDPIVRLYAISMSSLNDSDQLAAYAEIADKVRSGQISRLNQMCLAFFMEDLALKVGDSFNRTECLYSAIDAAVAYLEEESSQPNLRVPATLFFRHFSNLYREGQRTCLQACWSSGKISPWITHVAAGMYYNSLAWDSPALQQEFQDSLKRSEEHLLRAWQIAPQYPEAATKLIRVASSLKAARGTPRDWFYEAVHAQFDYWDAYSIYSSGLTTHWGGSIKEQIAFAQEVVATERFDTIVPSVFFDIVFDKLLTETGNLESLVQIPGVATTAKEFTEKLDAAVEKGTKAPANDLKVWGYLARVLVLNRDYDLARKIYVRHGQGKLGTGSLAHLGLKGTNVRGLAFAATGPSKVDVEAVEEFLKNSARVDLTPDQIDGIRQILDRARKSDLQAEAQSYYDDIDAVVTQLSAYHADQWVELPLKPGLPGWNVKAARMEPAADGFWVATSTTEFPGIQMTPMARFRPPFLCEAEFPTLVNGQSDLKPFGLIYGDSKWNSNHYELKTRALLLHPPSKSATIYEGEYWSDFQNRNWGIQEEGHRRLRLFVWPDRLDCYVNQDYMTSMPLPAEVTGSQFTIGEPVKTSDSNILQVRNIRVRRLRFEAPPQTNVDPETALKSYRKLVEIDPLSPTFWYQTGFLASGAGRHEEAVNCFSKAFEIAPRLKRPRLAFAVSLTALKRTPEAVTQLRTALNQDESLIEEGTELALIYATTADEKFRDGAESLKLAKRICDQTQRSRWRPLCALALAQAEMGQFAEAGLAIQEALTIAPPSVREYLDDVQKEIQAGSPIRTPPPFRFDDVDR